MRHRLFGSSLFLAAFAIVACGSPFEAGVHSGETGDDSDASGVATGTKGGPDGGTHVVGPPTMPDDDAASSDATSDAIADAHEDATHDAAHEEDATGYSGDATLNEIPDANADAHVEPPDTGPACDSTEKVCGNSCVKKNSAATGCAATSCSPCSLAHATAACDVNGACAVEACASGYEHCSGPVSGGCETSISTTAHCGTCTKACDSIDPYCSASGNTWACTNGCTSGTPTLCGDTCVNTTTSTTDCGGCTTGAQSYACTSPANGSPTCNNSTCGFTCSNGYDKCDNDACVSLTTDPKNCGTCDHACTVPTNGTATCAPVSGKGTCGIACNSPYSPCNGLCDDERSDVNNCGACNHVCPIPAHGESTCAPVNNVGTCGITCDSPYSVCNAACVNENTDVNNCGGCTTQANSHACTAPANATPTCGTPTAGVCGFTCNLGFQQCNGACVQADPTAVFVSASSSATSGCGAIGSPCGTITAGITYAVANGKTHVYVDHGTYPEQVVLENGLTIEGGWIYGGGSTWTKECTAGTDASSLSVIAPTSSSIAVLAENVIATLTNLTVRNDKTAAAGESLYGIFVSSPGTGPVGDVALNGVEVKVGNAGNGAAGTTDTAPALPSANTPPCAIGDGKAGGIAVAGTPIASGYTFAGFAPGSGGAGQVGKPGDNGIAGAAGTCTTGSTCDGDGCSATSSCGGQGVNGCGGSGGARGLGGGGGGASIALYVWRADVEMNGGSLAAGNGGSGAAGGSGALPPIAPTTGATGKSALVPTCVKTGATCTGGVKSSPLGGAGSTGGAGSRGGSGAAGSGGDSFSYYFGNDAGSVSLTGNPTLTFGLAGTSTAGTAYKGTAAAHN